MPDTIDFRSIIRLDSELNQIQDLDLLLERILLEVRRTLHADAGSIYIVERIEERGQSMDKLFIKYSQNDTMAKNLPPGQKLIFSVFSLEINEKTLAGYCALTKKAINVPDAYNLSSDEPFSYSTTYDKISGYKTTSILAVPLKTAEGRLLGVIQIINAKKADGAIVPFSSEDQFLVTHFAANATLILQRASITRAMILRMIKMAELRDPKETGTHVNRVAGYTVEIYDRWAYNHGVPDVEREQFRDTLKIAAMLHDVGKVAISDVILKKPARFTPEEFIIMQRHTIYGAQLFDDPQAPIDIMARDIALGHHENWDGTGYPGWINLATELPLKTAEEGKVLGKKGEEIPLTARIVAIADVYDALCSKRVYKEPWNESEVLEELRKLGGSKFDPELIGVFFEILPSLKQIQSLYPEGAE